MRFSARLTLLALTALLLSAQEPSAIDREPSAFTSITPGPNFSGWTRLAISPDKDDPTSQWTIHPRGVIVCEGNRGHEWLRFDKELTDFIFHVEFRFTKIEGAPRYNSGIFVRTLPDYSLWYQDQIGSAAGYFFGYILVDGAKRRFDLSPRMVDQRIRPAGEWNIVEITAQGATLTSWVNGAVVSEYKYCPVEKGHVGLEAEGFRIEFRNLKVKQIPTAPLQ